MGPVILAFLSVTILPMSNTQIGLTVSAAQLMGAVSQPAFGILADRTGGRWLGAGGVVWAASFLMLGLVGAQTGYFWLMFFPFVFASLGSGAFHPAGAMHAADSDTSRTASNLAYFFLLGQFGLALGPAVAGLLLDIFNPPSHQIFTNVLKPAFDVSHFQWWGSVNSIYFLLLWMAPVAAFMFFTLPSSVLYTAARIDNHAEITQKKDGGFPLKAFGVLIFVVVLRSLAQPGSVAFFPLLFQQKGWSPAEYGAIASAYWIASGIAGVAFGNLADRYDRRWIVAGSLALSAPAFFLLPIIDGYAAFFVAMLAGGLTGGSHSIIVVLAQQLIPASKGFASGAILGLIFGAGAAGSAVIGVLSDGIGLGTTFQIVGVLVFLSAIVALALPASQHPQSLSEEQEAAPVQAV
jgi:FSR family fosmidomycin resistance protein-like MFS transporter